jgi:hypothetical protein
MVNSLATVSDEFSSTALRAGYGMAYPEPASDSGRALWNLTSKGMKPELYDGWASMSELLHG